MEKGPFDRVATATAPPPKKSLGNMPDNNTPNKTPNDNMSNRTSLETSHLTFASFLQGSVCV